MWWLIVDVVADVDLVAHVDVVAHSRCGGSLVAPQTSGAEVSGSNPASTTMVLMRCRIIV